MIEGSLAPMTNLVKMLDALDTAVTKEEVLAIESRLMKLYRPSLPEIDRRKTMYSNRHIC